MCGCIKRLLKIYSDKVKPLYAERLALRYINAIKIPENKFELEDYFLTAPKIGNDLPQGLIQFFCRSIIQDDKLDIEYVKIQNLKEDMKK